MSTVTASPRTAGTTPGLAGILTVVIIGSIMSVLDVTIVNVAVHPLAGAFDAPLATVQWVATGYTLALVAVIPVAAWAMGRFGVKRSHLTAIVLFTIGSALASLSWNMELPPMYYQTVRGLSATESGLLGAPLASPSVFRCRSPPGGSTRCPRGW